MLKRYGFTLAEVLITLAIIGVVAAVSIPSVISNSQQQEFKTGLRKAVSVLNSAITMNMATDGESPYDNGDLFKYLQRHMSVLKSTLSLPYEAYVQSSSQGILHVTSNAAFYTADGMRFEFDEAVILNSYSTLHESDVFPCKGINVRAPETGCNGCGSLGLNSNTNNTTKPPCIIMVDVNGDKKPTPGNINCKDASCAKISNLYKVPLPGEKQV
ncbi:MAG: type II secretion system protein, partial [bacterium]|nr:type II secretion system protein [bacterium]